MPVVTEPSLDRALAGEMVDERLESLVQTISAEHMAIEQAGQAMISHAIRCGEALLEAKNRVARGQWEVWLADRFPDRSTKTWRLYMRIAKHKQYVLETGASSLVQAQGLLAGAPIRPHEQQLRDEAIRLHVDERLSLKQVAERLGVSHHAVSMWCNPERAERHRQRNRQMSKAAQRQARQETRDAQVREHGGALNDAYRKVRLATQTLEELLEQPTGSTPSRPAIKLAATKLRGVEDELVRAARLASAPENSNGQPSGRSG